MVTILVPIAHVPSKRISPLFIAPPSIRGKLLVVPGEIAELASSASLIPLAVPSGAMWLLLGAPVDLWFPS